MEDGQNMNALGRENGFLMKPLDQSDHAKSYNDIMARRLKNRERQRRYRLRKRLEADTKAASSISYATPLQIEFPVNPVSNNCVTRIHCRRDWKKDARRARTVKELEVISSNGSVIASLTSGNDSQATLLPSGTEAKPPIESNSERSITPSRRHWKTEARNRKN